MDLISKKELLETARISYGQLYRWKREGLIPEDWFIKKSSYTGQETFFPRQPVLERIRSILEMKDSHSLEELSKLLSPQLNLRIRREDIASIAEIAAPLLQAAVIGDTADSAEIAFLAEISALEIGLEKKIALVREGFPVLAAIRGNGLYCTVFEDGQHVHVLFVRGNPAQWFGQDISVVKTFLLDETGGKITHKYAAVFL